MAPLTRLQASPQKAYPMQHRLQPRWIIALALAAPCAPALALDCARAITTADTNACAHQAQQRTEAKLNQVYQALLKSLDTPDEAYGPEQPKAKLIAAQRAWVTFRERDCDAVFALYAGGTMRTVMKIGCLQNHATLRIQQLQDWMPK